MAAPATDSAVAPQTATVAANSSLYVGDLDRDVTEAQLFEIFSQIGPVASIRVCRDAVTRRSLGYAYVNYNSALDAAAAERALEQLNYTAVNGRPIRIMWSHRDPAARRSGLGNIFIKNLDKTIDNKALHDTFSAFGNILSCKVAMDSTGASRGYGFVHFETEEAARLAIEKMNGMQLEDKVVFVGPFVKRDDRGAGREARFTNVYVKNLDASVDDAALAKLAGEFGEVTSAAVSKDGEGKPRGFGFVNFKDADAAAAAVAALNGREVAGKALWAGRAQKKAEREAAIKQKMDEARAERIAKYAGMNLYVKNLPEDADDEVLRNEFAPFGTITSCKVMRDDKGKSRGFGFVCFTTSEEATRAVTEVNAKMVGGKPLYVSLAQRKEVRRAQLEQQMAARMALSGRQGPGGVAGLFAGATAMYYPGAMGPQGGGDFSDFEINRAVVYLANQGGAKFDEPKAPAPAASAAN